MFSPKRLTGLLLTSFLFTSCAPIIPLGGERKVVKEPSAVAKPKPVSAAAARKEAARVKANKEAAARRARLKKKRAAATKAKKKRSTTPRKKSTTSKPAPSSTPKTTSKPKTTTPPKPKTPAAKPKSKYRTATAIPGKPGFVFNPWTNKAVEVRGIPSGAVVRDPNDGNPDHKFRVP